MDTLIAGLIGTAFGLILKWVADYFTERQRNARADTIWRRERYVEAAAELLSITWQLNGANTAVVMQAVSLSNAQSSRNPDPNAIQAYGDRLNEAQEQRAPLPPAANRAFELLRLYAPPNVTAEGRKLLDIAHRVTGDLGSLQRIADEYDQQGTVFADIVRFHAATD